ncbi:hypothetical protein VitviT2T_027992 [Vitis vinifera]|uniref:Leucine-rich repeat-containing N-terminal plant-type domain-containing protein n=1 Tax=Vitis vinifera TaxID=29760 RepID=A0ABY9DTY5_VITVI|nr:hypothetical protein VitviT2T_027992 [Vitis vinifera]
MGNDFVITILVRLLLVHGFTTMSCSVICSSATNPTDQEALLAFKSQITFKSDDPLVSNWTTEASFCTWVGVSCSSHRQRVTALNLSFMGFQGTISPCIGNLSFLTVLDLSNNSIHGQLPETVEYGSEGRVSTKGDVYSYGIMLMETFTRKKPTHEMFVGGLSLRQWVDSSFPDLIMEVVDANLLARDQNNTNGNLQTCLLSIMGLGLQCSLDSPEQRLDMKEVVVRLSKIRQQYISQT